MQPNCDVCCQPIKAHELVITWNTSMFGESQFIDVVRLIHKNRCDDKQLPSSCGPSITNKWDMYEVYRWFNRKFFRTGRDKERILNAIKTTEDYVDMQNLSPIQDILAQMVSEQSTHQAQEEIG